MTHRRKAAALIAALAALACAATTTTTTFATTAPAASNASAQDTIVALSQAQEAVVGVQVRATEGARSAQTLGQARSGSGVVMGADGLVLTIGYLILEADEVQITTFDKKTVPARVVAYDLATGFGLIRPVMPLRGIRPAPLGSTAEMKTGEALMASTGASSDDDANVNMTQLVSKRALSGYWEYHIDNALFTSPPMQNHSGAPLFNQKGELVGIGSLFVMDAMGQVQFAALHIPNPKPEMDALIAATASVSNLILVTRNTKDFEPMGVRCVNPWVLTN